MAWVKLDDNYQFDPKILAAGAMAELLYVRSLAWAKRDWKAEGRIDRRHLAPLTLGIPGKAATHVAALVELELWTVVEGGWQITAWAKRNNSAEAIEVIRNERRIAGAKGNATKAAKRHANSVANESPDTDTETETEAEAEAAAAAAAALPVREGAPVPGSLGPAAAAALSMFVDYRKANEPNQRNPRLFEQSVRCSEMGERGAELRRLEAEGMSARQMLAEVWRLTPQQIATIPRPRSHE